MIKILCVINETPSGKKEKMKPSEPQLKSEFHSNGVLMLLSAVEVALSMPAQRKPTESGTFPATAK
jgi:hypothetical protein